MICSKRQCGEHVDQMVMCRLSSDCVCSDDGFSWRPCVKRRRASLATVPVNIPWERVLRWILDSGCKEGSVVGLGLVGDDDVVRKVLKKIAQFGR